MFLVCEQKLLKRCAMKRCAYDNAKGLRDMSVKGSWQRKRNISHQEWEDNDARIFRRKSYKYDTIKRGVQERVVKVDKRDVHLTER